jgi:hypothetical protein
MNDRDPTSLTTPWLSSSCCLVRPPMRSLALGYADQLRRTSRWYLVGHQVAVGQVHAVGQHAVSLGTCATVPWSCWLVSRSTMLALVRSSGELVGRPSAAHVRVPLAAGARVLAEFIEVWFSIISRKCLKRADFADATVATQEIEGFITTYNTDLAHHPFEWKKGVRFYKRP